MKEPNFDDENILRREQMYNAQLIVDLLVYSRKLEEMMVELRKEVNGLTHEGQHVPYPELHSNIYKNFDDRPAYDKHRDYIELFFKY